MTTAVGVHGQPRRDRPNENAMAVDRICGDGAPRVDTRAKPIHVHQSHRNVLNLVREAPERE
jgi:hypothetical protein